MEKDTEGSLQGDRRENFLRASAHFSWAYKLLGKQHAEELRSNLEKADIWMRPEDFAGISMFFSILAAAIFLVLEIFILLFVRSRFSEILGAFLIPVSFGITLYSLSAMYPQYKASVRAKNIAGNLEQTYIFISALANADVPLDMIFSKLSKEKVFGEVSREAEKIVRLMSIGGLDIYNAMEKESLTSPSEEWKSFLHGATSTAMSGSRMKPYFAEKVKDYHNMIRLSLKSNGDAVSLFAEVYVTVGVALPLFLAIILGVMSVISAPVSRFSEYVLIALSLVIEPVIVASFAGIISSVNRELGIR
ncbi:MAG: type II secretion system F family protein [Thermoplasmatales archaeon]